MRSLILSASGSCFTACPGCYNHFAGTVVKTDSIVRVCRELRDRCGLRRVTVGGGDPLVRADILTLLGELKALKLGVVVDTVGKPVLGGSRIRFMGSGTAPYVDPRRLAAVTDRVGIPLDGSSDEVHTAFRRFSSVEEQIAIVKALCAAGARVCVNTVVHLRNLDDIANVGELVARVDGVSEWQLFQYMPSGPLGFQNRRQYEITVSDFWRAVGTLDTDVFRRRGIAITPKSNETRKNGYLLMDSSGQLWVPRQTLTGEWDDASASAEREVIGHIDDADIVARVTALRHLNGERSKPQRTYNEGI